MLLLFFTILLNSFFKEDKQQGPSFHLWNQHSWRLCIYTKSSRGMKAGVVVLWPSGCVSLSCSVDRPTREPIHPESWEGNSRGHRPSGSGRPGQASLKLSSKQTGSNLSNSLHLPSSAPYVFPLEDKFKLFCYWKEEKHSLWVRKVQTSTLKSQLFL